MPRQSLFSPARLLTAFAMLGLCSSHAAQAQIVEVTLQSSQDTTLYENPTDLGNGNGEHLFSGRTASGERRRTVIRFSIPTLPADAIITSATLQMSLTRNATAAVNTYSLHRLTADWGEGTSDAGDPGGNGAPAQTNDATWRHQFFSADLWTTEGGDFDPIPSAQIELTGVARYSIAGGGMITDINQWRDDPASNQGWLLQVDETQGNRTARRFASRENAVPADRPVLVIQYGFPDPTSVPTLRPLALVALVSLMLLGLWHHNRRNQAKPEL